MESQLASKDWKIPVTPEYTARDTPQQNHLPHLVEIGFYIIASRSRRSPMSFIQANQANDLQAVQRMLSHCNQYMLP